PGAHAMIDFKHCAARLPAQDLGRARGWYADKLGLTPVEERPGGLRYLVNGIEFALYQSAGKSAGTFTQFGFTVADIEDAAATLRARGVTLEEYDIPGRELTSEGRELEGTLRELGVWGQRWLSRELPADELDTDALVADMRRRVDLDALPRSPLVARIETWIDPRRREERFLLLRRSEVSLCTASAGFPVELHVRAPLRTLTAWWRGDVSLSQARATGLVVDGRREWVRAFSRWFERYLFAGVPPAR
ncbi:MAG TPA: VOC family protein, partial [Myxococcaceae bacterium]|nr:VOC family protein [Myxococcaceae bacterium]